MLKVESLQSGQFSMVSTNQTVTITSVNLSKSILFVTARTQNNDPGNGCSTAFLENATTIRFRRDSSANNITYEWYVIEFTAGSDIDVQRGEVTSPTELNNDVTITSVGSLSEAFPMELGCVNAGSNFGIDDTSQISIPNVTTVRMFVASGQGPPDRISWQVVQSGEIDVQHVSQAATSSTNLNATITAIIDSQTSIFSSETASGTSNIGSDSCFRHWLTSTTNLNSQRDTGAAQHTFEAYVVEWPSSVSVQKFRETTAGSGTTVNFTLSPAVDTGKTVPAPIASLDALAKQAGDGGNSLSRFSTSLEITSSTNLQVVRVSGSDAVYRHVQAIEFTDPAESDLTPVLQSSYMG